MAGASTHMSLQTQTQLSATNLITYHIQKHLPLGNLHATSDAQKKKITQVKGNNHVTFPVCKDLLDIILYFRSL